MKIEINGMYKPGWAVSFLEDDKPIKFIREALVSIKPDSLPTIFTEQVVTDEDGHPVADGSQIKTKFVVYYPDIFSIEG